MKYQGSLCLQGNIKRAIKKYLDFPSWINIFPGRRVADVHLGKRSVANGQNSLPTDTAIQLLK